MSIASSGHRPASYPSPPTQYQAGALALRRFLQRTQTTLYHDYRAGFMDALGAYVLLTLEGCQLDPRDWDVLTAVKQQKR